MDCWIGAGAPKLNGEGWWNVDGLLGADPDCEDAPPKGLALLFDDDGVPKAKGDADDVGVLAPKPNDPVVAGRCGSAASAGLLCPKENPLCAG